MASPPVLDIENLLAPIAGEDPCGRDPRADLSPTSPFLTVKDAYDLAREAERNLERGFDRPEETNAARQRMQRGWAAICEHGPPLIGATGKDLRVAAWLAEALLRQRGLQGLRDGLLLLANLAERYWDGVFPRPDPEVDEEDGDARLLPFGVLKGSERDCLLAPALRNVALSDAAAGEPVSLWEMENRREDGEGSVEERLRRSTPEFKRDLIEDAEACLAAANALEKALEARCGGDAPGFAGLQALVARIADAVRPYAEALPAATSPPSAGAEPSAADGDPQRAAPSLPASELSRQSAFRQLEEIAAFFRQTEPHSPIAYALQNIVRRGRMSLPELMQELITDDAARQNYFVTAGMQPPENSA